MNLTLDRHSDLPLYRQVADQIGDLIRSGVLSAGCRLPTVRQLAMDHGLTRLTVQSGYAELQMRGLVESFVGRGTFVAKRAQTLPHTTTAGAAYRQSPVEPAVWRSQSLLAELVRMTEQPELLSFAQAIPAPETYPTRELRRAFRTTLDQPDALSYGPIQGEIALREQISRLLLERGIAASPDTLLIISGAQQGIDVALRALAQPGEVILVEEPVYPGIIELALARGQRVVTVPMDQNGVMLEALEEACLVHRPRLLYTVPTFHNPTGLSLASDRRASLLAIARTHDLLILEDDVYGMLSYEEPAPLPLKQLDRSGQVIYITSFSKSLAPGLRLGALVAAPDRLPILAAAKQSCDLVTSPLLQRVLATYLRLGHLEAHLQRVRTLYRERRDSLLRALDHYLPGCSYTQPKGGLSVWVSLPEHIDEADYCREAIERGVGIARGEAFFVQPQPRGYLRLSFGSHAPDQIEYGMRLLGETLSEHQRRRVTLLSRAGLTTHPLV
ncbi:MAG: PLP-dependent aminotransferase family protein [Ktedonobacterales bacterium]